MSAWILLLDAADERLLHALVARRRRILDGTVGRVTRLGDPPVAVAFGVLLLAGVAPVPDAAALHAVLTMAVSHLLAQAVKRAISRPRPRLPVGIASLVEAPDRFSFPSGHAAATLSLTLPLAPALPPAAAAALLATCAAVGVSRCYLGVHYPGDVAAGWLLAGATAVGAPWLLPWLG